MRVVCVGEGGADKGMRVERKGSGEGEKMTAEGGPFMMDVKDDYFFRLSAKSHK